MSNEYNDTARIHLNYVTFEFNWNWIKDKQIVHQGNKDYGMLWILNEDGEAVKAYGYELLNNVP